MKITDIAALVLAFSTIARYLVRQEEEELQVQPGATARRARNSAQSPRKTPRIDAEMEARRNGDRSGSRPRPTERAKPLQPDDRSDALLLRSARHSAGKTSTARSNVSSIDLVGSVGRRRRQKVGKCATQIARL